MGKEQIGTDKQLLNTETLGATELFRGEDPESLEEVLHSCRVRSLVPGEKLLEPDRDNRVLFIILAGHAEVRFTHEDSCSRVFVAPGECVGEMSIIEGMQPSATVVAQSHCQVLVIDADTVWLLIDRSPVVARNLLHILSMRVRRNNLALVQSHAQQRIHERNALKDSLTGLYNRRWMETALLRIVDRYARIGEPLALLMIDTDHFKRYNDKYGHLAGDELLASVACAITQSVRSTDCSCRYAGDEFVVALPLAGPAEAMQIAERVCRSVRKLNPHTGDDRLNSPASVSVGVASLARGMTFRQLLANADAALYRAKVAGRGRASR